MATRLTSVTRGPIAQDREADRRTLALGDKIGMASVAERVEVPVSVPAADEVAIAFEALDRHDEGYVGFRSATQRHDGSHDRSIPSSQTSPSPQPCPSARRNRLLNLARLF